MCVTYVCPKRDIECGRLPQYWCVTCPQRVASVNRPTEALAYANKVVERELAPAFLKQD